NHGPQGADSMRDPCRLVKPRSRSKLEGHAPGNLVLHEVERIEVGIPAREQILEAHPNPGLNGVFRLRARTEEPVAAPVGHAAHRLLGRVIVEAASDATADAA